MSCLARSVANHQLRMVISQLLTEYICNKRYYGSNAIKQYCASGLKRRLVGLTSASLLYNVVLTTLRTVTLPR